MDPLQRSSAMYLKRKLVDGCLGKDFKSRHVELEDVSIKVGSGSSDLPVHSCSSQPNMANDCVNYLKSGVPSRIMFYKQGSWCDFPEQIMKSLVDGFKGDKSSVVVVMDDQPLLVDFLSMTLVNLRTRKQRSVAWHDGTSKWFFPTSFFDEEVDESTKLDLTITEGGSQSLIGSKITTSPPEVPKKVVTETSPPVLQNPCVVDILRKKIVRVERGSERFLFVQNLFLSGMGSFAMPNNILHIHRYSPKDITAQCRLEAFKTQRRLAREKFGDANERYGWLGSRKQEIISIMINGFNSTGNPTRNADMGDSIYLSAENRASTSVGLCDVDEKGVQYMLLCRAIVGNMGATEPGSHEECVGICDSGGDICSNPNYYVMSPSHLSSHVCLEYLISFRLAPKVRDYLLHLKGIWLRPPPKEVAVDLSTLQPVMCGSGNGPTSPWISFRVLFGTMKDNISSVSRELLFYHYEEWKENKITREELVKEMMIIVGEKLLVDSLTKLNYSPSLWCNAPAEAGSYPVCTTRDSLSNGTRRTSVVPASPSNVSPAPSLLPEKFEPVDSKCSGSLAEITAPKVQHSSRSSLCSESSSSRYANIQNPLTPTMAPVVDDVLVRSALRRADISHSARQNMESNDHAPLSRSSSKGHGSISSTLTLETSQSPNSKGLHSRAPSMTPEAREFVAPSRTHENSPSPYAKGIAAATSSVARQVRAPNMFPQFPAPRSIGSHLRGLRSMAPHLREPSKISDVHDTRMKPEANYSSAAIMIPVICKPPLPSVSPKGRTFPTSVKECSVPSVGQQDPGCPANVTTKRRDVPSLENAAQKNPASQCGANKKQGVGSNSTGAGAADALIVVSANGEQGR